MSPTILGLNPNSRKIVAENPAGTTRHPPTQFHHTPDYPANFDSSDTEESRDSQESHDSQDPESLRQTIKSLQKRNASLVTRITEIKDAIAGLEA